jgi:hypothetical protein
VTRAQLGVAFATLGAVFAAASIIVAFGEGVTDFLGLAVLVLILIGIRGLLDRRRWAAWLLGAIALLDILGVWRLTAVRELAAWMPRYVIHVGAIAGQGLALMVAAVLANTPFAPPADDSSSVPSPGPDAAGPFPGEGPPLGLLASRRVQLGVEESAQLIEARRRAAPRLVEHRLRRCLELPLEAALGRR